MDDFQDPDSLDDGDDDDDEAKEEGCWLIFDFQDIDGDGDDVGSRVAGFAATTTIGGFHDDVGEDDDDNVFAEGGGGGEGLFA